jgi:SHS2 domain-containing protein
MYRWVEHVGELEVEIEAESETAVFEQGFEAMRDLLGSAEAAMQNEERRRVRLTAPDRPALLADWFSELAFLAESDGFVPGRIESIELDGNGLTAELLGVRGEPPHLVKAATYHRLVFERRDGGWRAKVILDV